MAKSDTTEKASNSKTANVAATWKSKITSRSNVSSTQNQGTALESKKSKPSWTKKNIVGKAANSAEKPDSAIGKGDYDSVGNPKPNETAQV